MLNVDCTHSVSDRKTKPGFARIPHHVVADSRLVGCDLAVLARLLYYARDKGFCWPSVPTLAKSLAKSDRTIQNAIGRLKRIGYLTTHPADNRTGRVISIHLDESSISPVQSNPPHTLHRKAAGVYVPPSGGQEDATTKSVSPPPHQSTTPSGETDCSPAAQPVSPEGSVIKPETRTETRTSRPANPVLVSRPTLRNQSKPLTPLDRLLLRFAEHDCSPEWVAKVLADDFADHSSYQFFLKIASRSSWVIPEAYTAARKPDAVCPVKVFAAVATKLAERMGR